MKNKIFTAILLLSIPFFLTACTLSDIPLIGKYLGGVGGGVVTGPVTLNVWSLWENTEVMGSTIQEFQTQNSNITVNYEDRSIALRPDKYKENVVGRLKEGGAPDVVLVHNTWLPYIKDYLAPMPSSYMSAQDYSQRYYPVIAESGVVDGKIYAVPSYYDGLVLVYNKDHFNSIDQTSPPTAWEEFRRIAINLTVKSDKGEFIRAGAAIGTADNIDFFSDILGLMFSQAGVSVPDGLNSKSAQDAISFYTLFVKSDGVWSNSLPEASKAFANEKVSMIFVPTWNLMDIVRSRPDLDIGVAPVPQAVSETPSSWGSFWMYAVPKSSSNTDAAWKFIDFLSQDSQQLAIFSEASKYRPYGAPFPSVGLASQIGASPVSNYIKPVLDTAPFAKTGYFAARSGNTEEVEALRTAVNAVLSGKVTSSEALSTCKQTLTQIVR
ncbi:extracellular solute-binding protein [Patescibacteria group bacterium]|nr:extracellular solute-binding protein [Patescibacteria group bacterium]